MPFSSLLAIVYVCDCAGPTTYCASVSCCCWHELLATDVSSIVQNAEVAIRLHGRL